MHWKMVAAVLGMVFSAGIAKAQLDVTVAKIEAVEQHVDKLDGLIANMFERGSKDEQMLSDIKETVDFTRRDLGNLREDVFQALREQHIGPQNGRIK